MTARTILHLPDGGQRVVRHKPATAVAAPPETPLTELTFTEMLAVRGFLLRAVGDIAAQLAAAQAEGAGRRQLQKMREAEHYVRSWLLITIASLDIDLKLEPETCQPQESAPQQ